MQGLAMAITERVGTAIHVRLQQVDATFDGDQVECVDMPGMGVQRQFLQIHGNVLGQAKLYKNLYKYNFCTTPQKHKAQSKPPVPFLTSRRRQRLKKGMTLL